jgi:hypothetical protein
MVLVFQAALAASAQPVAPIGMTNHTWRYLADRSDPGSSWALPGFDDSSWPQGRGLFGIDTGYPYPFATVFERPSLGGPVVACFRTTFNWAGSSAGVFFTMTNYFDDGVVIYLNGTELTRYNMPAGPVDHTTLAPGTLIEPVVRVHLISLDSLTNGNANPLVAGTNVLAVSVHNNTPGSSDTVFGLSLSVVITHPCWASPLGPTNRTVLEGRSTTFVVELPPFCQGATFQWYRDVGAGEELIPGATARSYTLTNAQLFDAGVYYCRLTGDSGTLDSRRAVLDVFHYDTWPQFLSASVVGASLNKFRLTTDHELCMDEAFCGADFRDGFNWQIVPVDGASGDLGVVGVSMLNPTTYQFTTELSRDPTKRYRVMVAPSGRISDVSGNPVPQGTFAETPFTLTFQQGDHNGYAGTHDAEIHANARADTPLGASTQMKADLDDAGVAQSLLRFDSIIGFSPGQVPPGVRIRSATLTLHQVDAGATVHFHRMLVSWDQAAATWNSLVDGVTANDVEALSAIDAASPARATNDSVDVAVTASVQAWGDGQPNYGWALLSTGVDGWVVSTSESGATTAPLLTVEFEHVDGCPPIITSQPPPTLVVIEGQSFSFSAGVSNFFGLEFQWTKDGVAIPGATTPTYAIPNADPLDSGTYRLRIRCESDPTNVVFSSPTLVTVLGDDTRVALTAAVASADGATVTLHFSKALNEAAARNPANYTFTPGLAMAAPELINRTSSATVTLTTIPRELGVNYTLRIANLRDTRAAANLIFPNPTLVALTTARVVVPWNADDWRYSTNNLDATAGAWKNPDFAPGPDWGTGCGLFGNVPAVSPTIPLPTPICTPLTPNTVPAESERRVTTYFRKTIALPPLPAGARYVICHYADDGFIAYLDAEEIHRFAMPPGAVTFTNRSTGIPTGEATYRSFSFNTTPGTHTLAVELHQAGVTSSDVLFGMEVRMVEAASPALFVQRTVNGGVALDWNADNNWRLRSADAVTGPFLDVAVPAGFRLGTFTLPAATLTNLSFWLLDYVGQP